MSDRYRFECPLCGDIYSGKEISTIARNAAWHWNKEHGDELRHTYEQIDTVERGGHQLHGNEYSVERIPIYVTAFDVMERIGKSDGMLVPADGTNVCHRCCRVLEYDDERVEVDTSGLNEKWRCVSCDEELDIQRRESENQQITEWVA
jgi:hypothetical protein